MSIFARPISQLTTLDLQELITDKAIENIRLEFKSAVPDKDETLKKLSSFANTFGGYVVVGATENGGRIEDLAGVDEVNGYKQKVVDWCFAGISPPLTVQVSDPIAIPGGNSKFCYVIHVPESDLAPHFLNGRKGSYIRTDEFSARFEARLAEERELRQLFDRRKLVVARGAELLERAKRRSHTFAMKNEGDSSPGFGPWMELCIVPRFPSRPLCEQSALEKLVDQTKRSTREGLFPKYGGNVVHQHESVLAVDATGPTSLFEVNIWGMLFYFQKIGRPPHVQRSEGIHLNRFVGLLVLFLKHGGSVLNALGYVGPIRVELALYSMRSVPWLYDSGRFPEQHHGTPYDDEISFAIESFAETLLGSDDVIADLLRLIGFSVNWPELVEGPENMKRLIDIGKRYTLY